MTESYSYESFFSGPVYHEMTSTFICELMPWGEMVFHYRKGDILRRRELGGIYLILSGRVNAKLVSLDGKEVVLYRMERGTITGETELFLRERSTLITEVVEAATVAWIPAAKIQELLQEKPKLNEYFLQSVIRKMNIIIFAMGDICFNDALGSVASFLIRQAYLVTAQLNEKKDKPRFEGYYCEKFTHEEIGCRLHLNRVTVTRVLKLLEDEDLISCVSGAFIIKDIEGMKKYINPIGVEPETSDGELILSP